MRINPNLSRSDLGETYVGAVGTFGKPLYACV